MREVAGDSFPRRPQESLSSEAECRRILQEQLLNPTPLDAASDARLKTTRRPLAAGYGLH